MWYEMKKVMRIRVLPNPALYNRLFLTKMKFSIIIYIAITNRKISAQWKSIWFVIWRLKVCVQIFFQGDTKDAAELHLYSLFFILYSLFVFVFVFVYFFLIWFKISLSLWNFFDSENIGLRHSLSLSKKFDRDNEHLNPILQHIFYTVLMSNFLARWQDGKK